MLIIFNQHFILTQIKQTFLTYFVRFCVHTAYKKYVCNSTKF